MTTTAEQADQQAVLVEILTAAQVAALAEFAGVPDLSPEAAAGLIREIVEAVIREFADDAALAAADFYDELRDRMNYDDPFAATLAPEVDDDMVQQELSKALTPLFAGDEPNYDAATGRSLGVALDAIGAQYRDTIALSAEGDPVGTRYARYASATACAFCRLMSLRGAAYRSRESAIYVVGEIDPRDPSRQIRAPRGSRAEGEKYHDFCKCLVVPVFPGDTLEQPDYVSDWQEAYEAAVREAGGTARADLSAILAGMRTRLGAR